MSSSRATRLWQSILEAIRGSRRDFTSGSLNRAIALLALPMVLEMAGESLFAVVDAFFVARLGAEALATVGLTESLLHIVYSLAIGISMATTAMVARRYGAGEVEAASRVAGQAIAVSTLLSLALGLAGALAAPRLLALLGASEAVVAQGRAFTQVMLGGMITVFHLFLINGIFRGAGDASVAMRSLWIANLINIVLDPCLILGLGPFPELGLLGAAVATNIGRGTAVVYQLVYLARGRGRLRLTPRDLLPDPGLVGRLLRVSVGGVSQNLIATASWIGLVRILAAFGSVAVAGYVLAIRIVVFAILPGWGLANAAATLVGQNLGALKPDRAERSVWLAGLYNTLFLGSVAVVFLLFAKELVGIFTADPAILAVGVRGLEIISYGYVFYAWELVMIQAFNGAGDTMTPTWINFFCFWLFQIPLAYALAHWTELGAAGIFWAVASAYSLSGVVAVLLFRRGRWKEKVV